MNAKSWSLLVMLALSTGVGCATTPEADTAAFKPAALVTQSRDIWLYAASLVPMNREISERGANGTATFILRGDQIETTLDVGGLSEGRHIAHVQGFRDGRDAICGAQEADRNSDGVIDAVENSSMAGGVVFTFNAGPAPFVIEADDYPAVDGNGRMVFRRSAALADLQASSQGRGYQNLDLDNYVVVVYGVSEEQTLPESVETLENIGPNASVPVACGVITRMR